MASRAIRKQPGGVRLFLQRKNIQVSHKLGLLDDMQAAGAYEDLRRSYAKLIKSKPIVMASPLRDAPVQRALYYTGPFRGDMTQYEARLILGITEAYVSCG